MKVTRREKHILIVLIALLIILSFIPQDFVTNNEALFILFVGFPIGLYIATDPDRRKAG